MDTFGEWLRQQRNELRLTRAQLAESVGCSVAWLRKIEDGEQRPSAQIAELIANSLNVPHADRSTFVKVARGELSVKRLSAVLKPVNAYPVPHTNLPISPTPLIGRQLEAEGICQLLHDPQCRLLTLVGPGGVGKTRLAVEVAFKVQEDFPDGVYFIPLAEVNSTGLIVPVIADAIGFSFHHTSHADSKTQLFSYLREKQALLLVDNLEQLVNEPGIGLLAELLASAAQVKLLATSRESLGLQEEWAYEVEGLSIPENNDREGYQNTSVELFLQRARRSHVGFNATTEDYPAIMRICSLVDGNPLGIELAAAWVRSLSCDEIAQEIEHGMDFLHGSLRGKPARHWSMRAVFVQSWKLLTDEEQCVLARLSVFRGGFRRGGAEVVAGASISVLSSLVMKSIIRRNGTARYDLHVLVRQFAAEHLSEKNDEQTATQNRHSNYVLTAFGRADDRMHSPAQREALAEWAAEMDNIRAAWDWAITHGEFGLIEKTLRAFAMLYETRGLYREGIDLLDRAIDSLEATYGPSPADPSGKAALGHLLTNRALLTFRLGHHENAKAMLERCLNVLRPLNDPRLLPEPMTYLGVVMSLTGDYAKALELVEEAREKALEVGDRVFAATSLSLHANFSRVTGQSVDQHRRLMAAVAEWREVGDPRFIAYGLNFLAQSALALGWFDEAREALEESVELNTSVGARWNLGHAFQGLGAVAQAQGEHRQAVDLYLKAVDTFTELGGLFYIGQSLAQMGHSLFALGNDVEAERIWRKSLKIAAEIHGTPVVLEVFVGLANLYAKHEDITYALKLLFVVLNHPASLPETLNRARNLQDILEAQSENSQVEAARAWAQTNPFQVVFNELLS